MIHVCHLCQQEKVVSKSEQVIVRLVPCVNCLQFGNYAINVRHALKLATSGNFVEYSLSPCCMGCGCLVDEERLFCAACQLGSDYEI